MKRKVLVLTAALFALLSCQKNESSKATVPVSETVTVSNAWDEGHVLRVNTSFYSLENDTESESDKTRWEASMALGEKVLAGKDRRATFAGDGKIYDFVEVRRDNGAEGLAFASQIAVNGSLAVVIDDKANLFRSPKTIDVIGTTLPRKTVVVWFPDTENGGFAEINAYDPETQAYRKNYIRLASLSRKESDIQSSILLQTALPLKNEGAEKVRKDALLESALLEYPDSAFSAEIMALANPNAAVIIKTEPVSRPLMSVNDNNVNVRDLPDPAAGRVIGQLNHGDKVMTSEQTSDAFTIGGQSARWYHIMEPFDGWVFGAYLE